jgi:hypothetical protein
MMRSRVIGKFSKGLVGARRRRTHILGSGLIQLRLALFACTKKFAQLNRKCICTCGSSQHQAITTSQQLSTCTIQIFACFHLTAGVGCSAAQIQFRDTCSPSASVGHAIVKSLITGVYSILTPCVLVLLLH